MCVLKDKFANFTFECISYLEFHLEIRISYLIFELWCSQSGLSTVITNHICGYKLVITAVDSFMKNISLKKFFFYLKKSPVSVIGKLILNELVRTGDCYRKFISIKLSFQVTQKVQCDFYNQIFLYKTICSIKSPIVFRSIGCSLDSSII